MLQQSTWGKHIQKLVTSPVMVDGMGPCVRFTLARKKESLIKIHQLALMDHTGIKMHMIDWDNTLLVKEAAWRKRDHGDNLHQEGEDMCHKL